MVFLRASLNTTGGFSVSSAVLANPFKDYFIKDMSSLLHFFVPCLGLQVFSSQRMSLVSFLSLCSSLVVSPYSAICHLSLSLSLQLPSATHCFKTILSFKWVSFLHIPPSFLAFIFLISSTWSSVKYLLVNQFR